MIFKRCIPPTAAPIGFLSLAYGFIGLFFDGNRKLEFENEIKEYFSTDYVFLASSGKAALTLILNGLSLIDSRTEVVIPAYTCYSVPASIIRAGLKIKLCDIDPDTLDYNYEKLEQVITNNTLCIVSSNLFGMPSDIKKLNEAKNKHNLILIEDVAQAMGCTYDDRKLGSFGDVAFFSLGRGKNVTCGSGGIIITSSKAIADAIYSFHNALTEQPISHRFYEWLVTIMMAMFLSPRLYCFPASLPFLKLGKTFFNTDFHIFKLSGSKIWMMKGWVRRLTSANLIRERNSHKITGIKSGMNYLRIPYLCSDKAEADSILNEAAKKRLGIVGMYPAAICDINEISSNFDKYQYESARYIADRLITIPSHQLLTNNDIQHLKELINKYNIHLINENYL